MGGKTWKLRGLIPRMLKALFSLFEEKNDLRTDDFKISACFSEIYNNKVYDLLDPTNDCDNFDSWKTVKEIN